MSRMWRSRRRVSVDGHRISQLIAAEEGHEASALITLGLQHDVISQIAGDEPKRPKRGSFFTP